MAGTGLVALKKEDLRCVLRRPRRPSPTLVPLNPAGDRGSQEHQRQPIGRARNLELTAALDRGGTHVARLKPV